MSELHIQQLEAELHRERRQRTIEENGAITERVVAILLVTGVFASRPGVFEHPWYTVALSLVLAAGAAFILAITVSIIIEPMVNSVRDWLHRND